jgi:hypothetical protein
LAGAEFGEGVSEISQRDRPGRHRAAVDRATVVAEYGAGEVFQHRLDLALDRMLRLPVIGMVDALGTGDAQEASVLAGAIVVQRRRLAGARHRGDRGLRHRPVGAAAQRRGIEPGLRQHARDPRDMPRLAGMRGAGQRQLFVAEAESVGGAGLDQRQGLQRLDRGARENRRCHIADGQHASAVGIGHGDGAAMPALDQRPAQDFDQNRVIHVRCASGTAMLRPHNPVACRAP